MSDEKRNQLTEMIEEFCDEYLNDEYNEMCLEVVEEMDSGKTVYYKKGKLELWASAIIYAVCQINSGFDETNEVHITRKDILNHFNTKQSNVSRKAVNLRDIYDLDDKFSPANTDASDYLDSIDQEQMFETIMNQRFDGNYPMQDKVNPTVRDYQKFIDEYKEEMGESFFKENEGNFWLIRETRPFMQCLLDQADLLWEKGEKEKAIDQYKYMLKLNPNDNQGVRDVLFPYLIELNRLDEAKEVYLQYEDDYTANWKYTKLLLDIKNKIPLSEIEIKYKECVDANPYVVPYLLGKKELPDKLPYFHGIGDENEAMFYLLFAANAWLNDKKAMKILKKLSKK